LKYEQNTALDKDQVFEKYFPPSRASIVLRLAKSQPRLEGLDEYLHNLVVYRSRNTRYPSSRGHHQLLALGFRLGSPANNVAIFSSSHPVGHCRWHSYCSHTRTHYCHTYQGATT